MVAPWQYLQKEQDSSVYDFTLSYETVSDWFSSKADADRRSAYKSYLIKEAIEQIQNEMERQQSMQSE